MMTPSLPDAVVAVASRIAAEAAVAAAAIKVMTRVVQVKEDVPDFDRLFLVAATTTSTMTILTMKRTTIPTFLDHLC